MNTINFSRIDIRGVGKLIGEGLFAARGCLKISLPLQFLF